MLFILNFENMKRQMIIRDQSSAHVQKRIFIKLRQIFFSMCFSDLDDSAKSITRERKKQYLVNIYFIAYIIYMANYRTQNWTHLVSKESFL